MFVVTVTLRNTFGPFTDMEAFINLDDAITRADEWATVGNVMEVTVTTMVDVLERNARDTGLLVGLGRALGYDVTFEEDAAA